MTEPAVARGTNSAGRVFIAAIALAIGLGAYLLLGGNDESDGPPHMLLGSVLILQPENFSVTGTSCFGRGRLSDIQPGASVTVRDGNGKVIATDTLEKGAITPEGNCRLRYGVIVPEVEQYVFVMGGQSPTRPTTLDMMRTAAANANMTGDNWWITHGFD